MIISKKYIINQKEMPRGAGRGRRGGYDAINSEKDPNKRMVMIMEREINNFKVTNQVKDVCAEIGPLLTLCLDYEQKVLSG